MIWDFRQPIYQIEKGLTMATTTVNNGVNVQALLDAREALKGAPEAAQFTWRASSKWQNGVRLLTPNWQSRLPGHRYEGPDPDGYMTMGEVIEFIERFAAVSRAPVRTGTNV